MAKAYQSSLFSLVTITGKGVEDREFLINYSHHDTKVWLTKTLIWALTNERQLAIIKATPHDMESRPLFTPRPELVS